MVCSQAELRPRRIIVGHMRAAFLSASSSQTSPPSPCFWICSFQRTLSQTDLDLFILKGLLGDFMELRILKELAGRGANIHKR